MQYTLRRVPPALDAALRRRARAEGKSLNQVAVEALAEAAGLTPTVVKRRSLADIAGTWKPDRELERALAAQHRVDKRLWR